MNKTSGNKQVFEIPHCELTNLFTQVDDVCWIQAISASLFLSDGGRRTLWPQIFKFRKKPIRNETNQVWLSKMLFGKNEKITEYYIPTGLRTFEENNIKNKYVVWFEKINFQKRW